MVRWTIMWLVLGVAVAAWAQQGSDDAKNPAKPSQTSSPASGSPQSPSADPQSPSSSTAGKPSAPNLAPPHSDRVDAGALSDEIGESSSKDTQIDLSPPENDARAHPQSAEAMSEAEAEASGVSNGVGEFHSWDPHKAAKSVEVGDFYFKRKNYRAAEDRYREALGYKDNDAVATFRLAVCLEKLQRPDDARAEYESYLRILPHGPLAEEAQRSIERLKNATAKSDAKSDAK
jgi:tetratricopeptide (TPR) repeat protein